MRFSSYLWEQIVFRNHVVWLGIWCNNLILYLRFYYMYLETKYLYNYTFYTTKQDDSSLFTSVVCYCQNGLRRKHGKCSLCNEWWHSFMNQRLNHLVLLYKKCNCISILSLNTYNKNACNTDQLVTPLGDMTCCISNLSHMQN
jgi:hypothetical protein